MTIEIGGWGLAADVLALRPTIAQTEVFTGNSPTAWTDLDLSAVVGANLAIVLLKITLAAGGARVAVRKNGDTDDQYSGTATGAGGAGQATLDATKFTVLIAVTDSAGIIEWITNDAVAATVDIIAYLNVCAS